jgi:hypothetical protein
VSAHQPVRPSWTCAGCGAPWPCATRRRELRAEFDGATVSLGLYMAPMFVDACEDLADAPAGELYWRFLGWLRT